MTLPISQQALFLAELHYKRSHDFNGITLAAIQRSLECEWSELRDAIAQLIKDGTAYLLWPEVAANTHINRLGPLDAKEQHAYIEKLAQCPGHTCLYPTRKYLEEVIDQDEYQTTPYTLELALGEPQLAFRTFDLHVLETYRNDPRYRYSSSDIAGSISIADAHYASPNVAESDKILLQSFGFAYDEKLYRAVAVFLRYLSDLSPEHQQIWKAREVSGDFKLHPDYFRSSIMGEFPENVSIFEAYAQELHIINSMCKAMARPPLFKIDFQKYGESRPARFSFLLRPTLEEYNAFAHLLDKLLSDNISSKFFGEDLKTEEELTRKDGRVEVRQKGTIRQLDEWIRQTFALDDWEIWDKALADMKAIRQERQKPAHHVEENSFDPELIPRQRELMKRAYNAVRTIRMIFENHPGVQADSDIKVPDWLREGKIWTL